MQQKQHVLVIYHTSPLFLKIFIFSLILILVTILKHKTVSINVGDKCFWVVFY